MQDACNNNFSSSMLVLYIFMEMCKYIYTHTHAQQGIPHI